MTFNIALDLQTVNALLNLLGQLPTSSGAWPIAHAIKTQADQQATQQAANAPAE